MIEIDVAPFRLWCSGTACLRSRRRYCDRKQAAEHASRKCIKAKSWDTRFGAARRSV